jgi:hypothetical protein
LSPREELWVQNVRDWQADVCKHLPQGEITDLIAAIAELRKNESAMVRISDRREPDLAEWKNLLSAFTYDCSCDDAQSFVHVAIEPQVGLNRDNRKCLEPLTERYTQSKAYLLPLSLHGGGPGTGSITAAAVHAAHRSRLTQTLLFDAGAHISRDARNQQSAELGGSTDWLVNWYGPSVTFDSVYAWALPKKTRPVNFDNVDPQLIPHLHFYPHAVNEKDGDAFNVLTLIKTLCRPEDFVVFKLAMDIDPQVEEAIAHKVMTDPDILALVDEFYWKRQSNTPLLGSHRHGGNRAPGASLSDWYDTVIPARKRGLRIHSWS